MMELIAACFSASGVWLTAQRCLIGWPISLLATFLYGWVFFHARLYADTILQGVFSLTILYGWALWARDKARQNALPPQPLALKKAIIETLGFFILSTLWVIALRCWSDDPAPLLDGGLSGASLLAQLWTARRHRISWLLWAGIDVIYTGLFFSRSLSITTLLYGGYTLLGLYGYWRWKA